MKGLKWGY